MFRKNKALFSFPRGELVKERLLLPQKFVLREDAAGRERERTPRRELGTTTRSISGSSRPSVLLPPPYLLFLCGRSASCDHVAARYYHPRAPTARCLFGVSMDPLDHTPSPVMSRTRTLQNGESTRAARGKHTNARSREDSKVKEQPRYTHVVRHAFFFSFFD